VGVPARGSGGPDRVAGPGGRLAGLRPIPRRVRALALQHGVNTSATDTLVPPEETATTGEQAWPVHKHRPNVRITGQKWEA
jgi:hypothetical protein